MWGPCPAGLFRGIHQRAVVLTNLVSALFGVPGSLLLAAIFLIACFNVCVGLISSCAEYFSGLWPRLPYRAWAALFAAVSLLIANAGLDQILRVSVPVLSILYPVAIVLIALSFFQRWLCGLRLVYPAAVLLTGAASILYTLRDLKLLPAGLGDALGLLPLAAQGLGWLLPALAGTLLGRRCRGCAPPLDCGGPARLLVESAAEEAQTRRAPGSQIRGRVRMVPVTG